MIASVHGRVQRAGLDHLVVDVGGVGILVHTTPATAAASQPGRSATLATSLVVREDSLTLYGFAAERERDVFETVQTVSGVGPRLALAMLSVMGPDDLAVALGSADVAALTKVPGIGRKGAERLVLELRDKLGASSPAEGAPPAVARQAPWREQVTEALVGLGWSARQAGDAVDAVTTQVGAEAEVAEVLRAALRRLGR